MKHHANIMYPNDYFPNDYELLEDTDWFLTLRKNGKIVSIEFLWISLCSVIKADVSRSQTTSISQYLFNCILNFCLPQTL